jgi:hypothetical protein
MKSYDSIPHWNKGPFGEKTIAFDKIDGSSMRFEWNIKSGWYKFGTKSVMIDRSDENFGDGIDIFVNKYGEDLNRIFRNKYSKILSVVVFAEYFGQNSFSGQHVSSDKKDVCLFDVSLYKKEIINPYEFIDNFGHLDIPKVIYEGEYNMKFINDVRENVYNLSEGVVAKGILGTRKGGKVTYSAKVKTNNWLKLVREKLGEKALLDELNNDKNLISLCYTN